MHEDLPYEIPWDFEAYKNGTSGDADIDDYIRQNELDDEEE